MACQRIKVRATFRYDESEQQKRLSKALSTFALALSAPRLGVSRLACLGDDHRQCRAKLQPAARLQLQPTQWEESEQTAKA